MRHLVLLALAACSTSNASKLDPQPVARNLVCERVALLNPSAKCVAEFTDSGEAHIHSARVTFEAKTQDGKSAITVVRACGLTAAQLGMVCSELSAQPKPAKQTEAAPAPEAQVDAKPAAPPKDMKK